MTTIQTIWDRIGAWLMRHWIPVIGVALGFLFFTVLLTGKKSQDAKETVEQAVQQNVLSKKEVRRKEQVIAQKLDSIRTQTIYIERVVKVRDSAVVAAKHHEATADSLLKSKPDEDFTSPSTATVRVESFLSSYRPKAYALSTADSLK